MGYFDTVGIHSFDAISQAAEACTDFVGPRPKCYVTSALRDVPNPYHGTGNACDFGNDADQWAGSPEMDGLSRWLAATYGPYCLELIHVYQDGTTEEWKFGVKQPTGWYGWDTLNAHRGHVHFAATLEGIAAGAPVHQAPPPPPLVVVDEDPFMAMPTINTNKTLKMTHPDVQTAQALLAVRGAWIAPKQTDRKVLIVAVKWFQGQAKLKADGVIGATTWKALAHPPGSNARG